MSTHVCAVLAFCLLACTTESGKTTNEKVDDVLQTVPTEEVDESGMAFYWYEDQKVELSESTTHRAVRYLGEITEQVKEQLVAALNVDADSSVVDLGNGIFLIESTQTLGDLPAGVEELKVFVSSSGAPAILTKEFIVRFKAELTRGQIDEFNESNKVRIVQELTWGQNGFVLAVPEGGNSLAMANRYYESGLALYAEPNFVQMLSLNYIPDDTHFGSQWGLQNTGQNGGIPGKDIHVVDAWDITLGSPEIVIAIIDEGVDYGHADLCPSGKCVTGYDSVLQRNDPNPVDPRDYHGTACAGIAAAAGNNGMGISGVAPQSRIMGVRAAQAAYDLMTGARLQSWAAGSMLADGIAAAAERGADVLSNSWSGGSQASINDAIRYATTHGRGGRGSVVVFSAGNDDGPVRYPAFNNDVIAVAACNAWGEHKNPRSSDLQGWGSSYGPQVVVCAPGVSVYTTDNGGAYRPNFNGTSAAAPHVAGVVALMLSVNPDLRVEQIKQILRETADEINPLGYAISHGMVNAHKAVVLAQKMPVCTISAQTLTIPQEGGQYDFQVNCTNSPTSYAWTVNGQAMGSNSSTLTLNIWANNGSTSAPFRIAVTASNDTASSTAQIELVQLPPINLEDLLPHCEPISAPISAIPSNGGTYTFSVNCSNSPTSYAWTVNGQAAGSSSNMSYGFSANTDSGERSFTLVVTASNGVGTSTPVQLTLTQPSNVDIPPVLPPDCFLSANPPWVPPTGGSNCLVSANCIKSSRSDLPTSYAWTLDGKALTSEHGDYVNYNFPPNTTTEERIFTFGLRAKNSAGEIERETTCVQFSPITCSLRAGEGLYSGQKVFSPNGLYTLAMQADGNLVLYDSKGLANWAACGGGASGVRAAMQEDGNLVLYSGTKPIWSTQTGGTGAICASVQDDGNFVLYKKDGTPVWASVLPSLITDKLSAGERMAPGHALRSPNGLYTLIMQEDGNLVLYSSAGTPLWSTHTGPGNAGASATLQCDGNFVVRSAAGNPLWSTQTGGQTGTNRATYVAVQNDGNFVLYKEGGTPVWDRFK
ncbi:MAG: S8 family serine peptidase [Cystobacterineae bacterium]|nr:S8 family serine peptidase [Cystobacterineae bacterium]